MACADTLARKVSDWLTLKQRRTSRTTLILAITVVDLQGTHGFKLVIMQRPKFAHDTHNLTSALPLRKLPNLKANSVLSITLMDYTFSCFTLASSLQYKNLILPFSEITKTRSEPKNILMAILTKKQLIEEDFKRTSKRRQNPESSESNNITLLKVNVKVRSR